jgi:hypothetical protein
VNVVATEIATNAQRKVTTDLRLKRRRAEPEGGDGDEPGHNLEIISDESQSSRLSRIPFGSLGFGLSLDKNHFLYFMLQLCAFYDI